MNDKLLKELQEQQGMLDVARLKQLTQLMESIPSFARDIDESEWTNLLPAKDGLYSESSLGVMQQQVDKLYYGNPSARGVIDTMVNFIIGKDAAIVPNDPDPAVNAYWKSFYEVNGMDLRIKEWVRRTLLKGESFLRVFEPSSSSVNLSTKGISYYNDIPVLKPVPLVRFVEPGEIKDPDGTYTFGIHTNSDDVEEILNYIRTDPNSKAANQRTVIEASEIIHTKILVDSNVKRGISFLVGIAEYMVKYHDWLEDRISLNRMRTMFNLIMKVTGAGSPSQLKDKFSDSASPEAAARATATGGDLPKELPKRGGVLLSTANIEYEFLNPDIKAQDTVDDGRAIDLMLAKGTGLTEYIVRGDASNANYSSSMVSESPMVRMFQSYQDFFSKPIQALYRKIIRYGIENDHIPAKTKKTTVIFDAATEKREVKKETTITDHSCKVTFEALIHRDVLKEAQAYAIHSLYGWDSDAGLTAKLGNDYVVVQKDRVLETSIRAEREEKLSAQKKETADKDPENKTE